MSKPKVLFEDNHLLVLEKPNNWLVQGNQTGDGTLTDWGIEYLRRKYNKPGNVFCQPCHRLDRPVGGVIVFARTSKALERMNKLFHDGEIKKTSYGTLSMRTTNKKESPSELSYAMMATINGISLLKIKPVTGRSHQIRVQMRKLGCLIKGDLKYGYPHPNEDKSINLHSYQLAFVHPVKKENVAFTSRPDWPEYKHFIA